MAVAIVVAEGTVGAPARIPHTRPGSGVGEGAVAVVAQEHVRAECGDVGILEAVVVVVGNARPHAPAACPHLAGPGHIVEAPRSVIPEERNHRVAAAAHAWERRAVDDQRIEVAVLVVIEQRGAVAVHLDDVVLRLTSADVQERETRLLRGVHELDRGGRGGEDERRRDQQG